MLLALPASLAMGLLHQAENYFRLPKGYYGLRILFLMLAFLALARLTSLEQLRYWAPGKSGKLLGLDRIPEVRTVSKKLANDSEPLPHVTTLQAVHSLDHDGAWSAPETLYTSTGFVVTPAVVIDARDRITVAFREQFDGLNHIQILRYAPGEGWSGPTTVYQTPDFFQQVDAAVDAAGNVVVSFDPGYASRMASIIYDAAAETWSDPVLVSPADAGDVVFATLIQNRTRTHLYAVYWETDGPTPASTSAASSPPRSAGRRRGGCPGASMAAYPAPPGRTPTSPPRSMTTATCPCLSTSVSPWHLTTSSGSHSQPGS